MKKGSNTEKSTSIPLTKEQEEQIIMRCFRIVDYVTESAANNIINFVQNPPCSHSKQILLDFPETLAIKVFQDIINDIIQKMNKHSKRPVH